MLLKKSVPLAVVFLTTAVFSLSPAQAQVVRPIANPTAQPVAQSVVATNNTGPVSAASQTAGCTGCQSSSCNGDCGVARPGVLSRLRNALPSIEMSIGNNSGCGCAYRSIFGGWNDLDDYNGIDGASNAINASFNDGFLLGTARGRYLNDLTRVEMEGSWRNNSGNSWSGPLGTAQFDGHFNNFSTMFNVIRDLPSNGPVNFYGGLGAGFSRQDGDFTVSGNAYEFDDWAFAYQGIAGMNVRRSQGADFFVEYRYFANTETDVEGPAATTLDGFNYTAENIVFGFRFKR